MATRLINIPRFDVDAKKALKTKQYLMSGDTSEIYINLYENGQPKPILPNTQFTGYGMLYKAKEEITPIPNSQFKILDAEQGKICLFLTPLETRKNDVLMIQIALTDNDSECDTHGTTHFCTQYFLITILKSQCPGGDVDQIYKLICDDNDFCIVTDNDYYIEI